MNLNNWLCKHFDENKKGYVNVGDVLYKLLVIIFFGIAGTIILTFLYAGMIFIININERLSPNSDIDLPGFFGFIVWAFVFIILLVYVCSKISQIKIAKCPLKEDDNK